MLKGKIAELRLDITLNKGNYESEKLGMSYAPTEEENALETISHIKNILYTGGSFSPSVLKEEKVADKPKTAATTTATTPKKTTAAVKEDKKVEETTTDKVKEEEVPVEDTKAEETPKKTKHKIKVTEYDRDNGTHKKKLSEILTNEYPTWKKDDKLKKNALEASNKLTEAKTPFIDNDGNVVPEFLTKLKEIMEA